MTTKTPALPPVTKLPAPSRRPLPTAQKTSPVEQSKVEIPAIITGRQMRPKRTILYGKDGVGKTTLAAMVETVGLKPLVLDCEGGSWEFDIARLPIESMDVLRAVLHDRTTIDPYDVIVVDNLTKCEELACDWTLQHIPHEKGSKVDRIEGYGYGKGYTHLYDSFMLVMADLDVVARSKHVIAICHACAEKVPNAGGEDYLQYQPRLYPGSEKGKNNIRARIQEWADYGFYIEFDKAVTDGKAIGVGDRTIYTTPQAHFWAKTRSVLEPYYPFELDDATLWQHVFGVE